MLIGTEEIMKLLNVGRPTATRIAKKYLGKSYAKRSRIRVPKDDFVRWVGEGNC